MSNSPWGQIDNVNKITTGVSYVDTPRHGGLRIAKGWGDKNLSKHALKYAIDSGEYYWFEENVDWAVVAFEHQELFKDEYDNILLTLNCYRQKYLLDSGFWNLIDKVKLEENIKQEDWFTEHRPDKFPTPELLDLLLVRKKLEYNEGGI